MTPPRRPIPWLPLLAAVLFAAAYTQPALYFSNQNQYFLHGLAAAGVGDLRTDWLANTADPTPAFSFGVEWSVRLGGAWLFPVGFFALLMAYFLGLWHVALLLPFAPRTTAGRLALAAGLVLVHSSILRVASAEWLGVDYPWYFQAGVAHQYVLGAGLQPSAFGVLLLVALAMFAQDRPRLAALLAALACALHPTYLLPAGLLVAGMLTQLRAFACGALALVAVAPILAHTTITLGPSDADTFARAQRIIAWERIPHHTDVRRWLDWIGALQVAWAAAGVLAFRRTALFWPLLVGFLGGLALSLVQVATANPTLALAFPWRISAILVPLATAAALAGLARVGETTVGSRWLGGLAGLVALVSVAGAMWVYLRPAPGADTGLIEFVRATRQPGDVYLLPASLPPPSSRRGVGSMTFVPPRPGRPVVFELERFRLASGAAAYIDSKAIPYRDVDVLEWRRRVADCERWYAQPDWDRGGVIDEVQAAGITHVVVPAGLDVRSTRLELVHADPAHRVYRLRRA